MNKCPFCELGAKKTYVQYVRIPYTDKVLVIKRNDVKVPIGFGGSLLAPQHIRESGAIKTSCVFPNSKDWIDVNPKDKKE